MCVAAQVVGLQAVVDKPLAVLQRIPPAMIRSLAVKGNDLEIRAVRERDKDIMTADRMPPPSDDRKAEIAKIPRRLIQIADDDNEMIDP